RIDHDNKMALTWAKGTAVMAFLGAGVLGFLHTLAPVNFFTHGTQLTAAHGHLSFFGAYIMILFTIISYAMPILRGRPHGNCAKAQAVERASFWMMVIGMLGVTSALVIAGTMQVFLQRLPDVDALSFMATQTEIVPVYMVRLAFGVMSVVGLFTYFYSFFVKEEA
ncbi:MAG TPA: nitric-oxide reductase large subunit, partial [Sulfurimonas sp.]|nr:nitric-oxide reductase large subunit [Sulfurimonas sp.]